VAKRRHRTSVSSAAPHFTPGNSFVWPALLIFAVALSVRLIHIAQIRRAPFFAVLIGDAHAYDAWATRLASGDWLGRDVFYQAPLYPYFLGALYTVFGRSLMAVRLCQAILGALGCVCLAFAARNLFSKRVGVVAGLMLALYAPSIFLDALIQKSVLDVFFICVILWIVSRLILDPTQRRHWFWLGLTMGGLSLTRENALVLIAVLLIWALWGTSSGLLGKDRLVHVAVFLLGLILVVLPVAVRNSFVGGGLYVTTAQFGPNFYIGNSPGADGTYKPLRIGRGLPEFERQDATELAEQARGRPLTPAEVSRYWTGEALAFITSQPLQWVRLLARKTALIWNATEVLDSESQDMHAEWSLPLRVLAPIGHFGVLVPLAAFGVLISWPRRSRLSLVYAMMLAYAASVVMFYVFARYRLPLVPFLILFAATGLMAAPSLRVQRSRRWIVTVSAMLGALATLVNWPLLNPAVLNATSENNLGSALQTEGRFEDALHHYRRALALRPDYAQAHNNLGTVLARLGRPLEALDHYEGALRFDAGLTQTHVNWGNAFLDLERYAEAVPHFRTALESDPNSVPIMNSMAAALAGSGDSEAAIQMLRRATSRDPNSAETRRNLGGALAAGGAIEEAVEHLRRAATLEPHDVATRRRLANLLVRQRHFEEAIALLRATQDVKPDSSDSHIDLGIALASTGQIDEAIRAFRRALELQPNSLVAQRNLEIALALAAR
jgi:tetratricopeptide (TPR) repeat protein